MKKLQNVACDWRVRVCFTDSSSLNQICQPGRVSFDGTYLHCYTLAVFQSSINISYARSIVQHLFDGLPDIYYSNFDGIPPGPQGVSK